MGELERERQARRLSISPSHVRALLAAGGLLFLIGFLIGMQVGRSSSPPPAPVASTPASEAELVEVLARVEANAGAGGLEALTYPDALPAGDAAPLELPEAQGEGLTTVVEPGLDPLVGVGQALPSGWFVSLTRHASAEEARSHQQELVDEGQDAVLRERRTDGVSDFEVLVGPLSQGQAAEVHERVLMEWPEAEVVGTEGVLEAESSAEAEPPDEPAVEEPSSEEVPEEVEPIEPLQADAPAPAAETEVIPEQ